MTTLADLEREMLKMPQIELDIDHEFCEGVYARTMVMPAGSTVVGMTHAHGAFTVVRSGRCTINTGNGVAECFGGELFISEAGAKRAFHAYERTVITCFLANPHEMRNPEKLWEYYTVENNLIESEAQGILEA